MNIPIHIPFCHILAYESTTFWRSHLHHKAGRCHPCATTRQQHVAVGGPAQICRGGTHGEQQILVAAAGRLGNVQTNWFLYNVNPGFC